MERDLGLFWAPVEWALNAKTVPGALVKLAVVMPLYAAPGMALVTAPFLMKAQFNAEAMREEAKAIDHGPAVVFRTVDQCGHAGNSLDSCRASWKQASIKTRLLGTEVSYLDEKECTGAHGPCRKSVISDGFVTVTTYHPSIVGWQASANDLRRALPLYATHDPAVGVRADKVKVTLP